VRRNLCALPLFLVFLGGCEPLLEPTVDTEYQPVLAYTFDMHSSMDFLFALQTDKRLGTVHAGIGMVGDEVVRVEPDIDFGEGLRVVTRHTGEADFDYIAVPVRETSAIEPSEERIDAALELLSEVVSTMPEGRAELRPDM